MTPSPEIETAANAINGASILNHIKSNRLEYALVMIFMHLLGVSDRVLSQINGVCF